MNITFVGLSCFHLESDTGGSVLFDPYHDDPAFYLGLHFPSSITADIVLVSHPDEDHSYLHHGLLKRRRPSQEEDMAADVSILRDINLRGHLVREWNGDINIAYAVTIDGIRFLHLADNAHILTQRQLDEIGPVDILFISPPKYPGNRHMQNISLLQPSIIIPSHYIPLKNNAQKKTLSRADIKTWYQDRLSQDWITNSYINDETIEMLTNLFMGAQEMGAHFPRSHHISSYECHISPDSIKGAPRVCMFNDCLGK